MNGVWCTESERREGFADEPSLAAYEHLVRTILQSGSALKPVITTFEFFVDKPNAPVLPRVQAHVDICSAYGIKATNIHRSILEAVQRKEADLDILRPFDGAHPDDPGYESFFRAVRDQFDASISAAPRSLEDI